MLLLEAATFPCHEKKTHVQYVLTDAFVFPAAATAVWPAHMRLLLPAADSLTLPEKHQQVLYTLNGAVFVQPAVAVAAVYISVPVDFFSWFVDVKQFVCMPAGRCWC
jgi:hypothetical protein